MWAGAGQKKMFPKIAFHGTRVSMQTKILSSRNHPCWMPAWIWLCPNPAGPSDAYIMTQLLPSRSQPTLIATLLPLHRVSHCPVGAAVSAKHLGELKQASMLKSGSISKQQKGTIFPIWFAPLGHPLSHRQSCWEQNCILTGEHLCL